MRLIKVVAICTWICLVSSTTVPDNDFYQSETKYRFKPAKLPNVIYGKGIGPKSPKYVPPSPKPKALVKFKPSQEVIEYDAENFKPIPTEFNKYIQNYAHQIFTAQKNAAHLSDAQKHVLAQSYFPIAPVNKPEFQTEKYQSLHLQQHVIVQPSKTPVKAAAAVAADPPKQPTQYKTLYTASDTLENATGWTSYEPYQSYGKYGIVAPEKASELSTITGFKIPLSVASHNSDTKEISAGNYHEEEHYPHHEPKYEYMYQVHDQEKHNNFGHAEARKGKNTYGKYYVQLPDGRLETVKYYVDKNGYHAEVDFKGQAKHPSSAKKISAEKVPLKDIKPHTYSQTEELSIPFYSVEE